MLADIEKDGAPILITQHGLPPAHLVDVEAYDALQQRIRLLDLDAIADYIALDNPAAATAK